MVYTTQGQVYTTPSLGISGQPYNVDGLHVMIPAPRASVIFNAGSFVWYGTAPAGEGSNALINNWVSNTGTGTPVGFAYAMTGNVRIPVDGNASMQYAVGSVVNVATQGTFLLACGVSTQGQKIFAKLSDGSAVAGNAGATIAGYEETNYSVLIPADATGLSVITKLLN